MQLWITDESSVTSFPWVAKSHPELHAVLLFGKLGMPPGIPAWVQSIRRSAGIGFEAVEHGPQPALRAGQLSVDWQAPSPHDAVLGGASVAPRSAGTREPS